jgi:hypothetical protein
VQDLQVHQGHAEHVLGRGLLGRSRGGGEYSTINDIILYVEWKGKKRFHKKIFNPNAALYLETGCMTIRTTIKARRANYLYYLKRKCCQGFFIANG